MANDEFVSHSREKSWRPCRSGLPVPIAKNVLKSICHYWPEKQTEKIKKTETELQDRAYKYLKQLVSDLGLVLKARSRAD